jgi:uncharacterized membrane protein YbhN (UPF0104 family)
VHAVGYRRAMNIGRARLGRPRRRFLVPLALVLALGTGALIGRAADYARLAEHLREADPPWFPLLLGGEVVAYLGYILVYREMAGMLGGPRLRLWLAARIAAASFGAYVVASSIGGLGVDYWALRRAGVEHSFAFARVIALKTLEWAILGAGATLAAAVLLVDTDDDVPLEALLPWLVLVPLCYLAAAAVSEPARLERLRSRARGRVRRVFADTVLGVAFVRHVLTHPVQQAHALAGACCYWAGNLVALWAGLRAFGVELGLAALVLAYATGYAATMLPLPVGGAGGVDASMTFALTVVGVPLEAALLGVFAFRLVTFWLPLVPGIVASVAIRGVDRELPQVGYVRDDIEAVTDAVRS